MTKKCPKCKAAKELNEFYVSKKTKDGYRSWCKSCGKSDNAKREPSYNESRRNYRAVHKEESRKNKINYYNNNKAKILEKNSKWRQTVNGRLLSYKVSAIKRKILWELTFIEFESFWQVPCYYCGSAIDTIGIDRKDNKLGYSINNCVSCCSKCNRMKMNLTINQFYSQINKIWKNIQKYEGI